MLGTSVNYFIIIMMKTSQHSLINDLVSEKIVYLYYQKYIILFINITWLYMGLHHRNTLKKATLVMFFLILMENTIYLVAFLSCRLIMVI